VLYVFLGKALGHSKSFAKNHIMKNSMAEQRKQPYFAPLTQIFTMSKVSFCFIACLILAIHFLVFTPNVFASPECSDGIDNDGDAFIDYPNDPKCIDADDTSEAEFPFVITLTSDLGSNISPRGPLYWTYEVTPGTDIEFSITANAKNSIFDVLIDQQSIGRASGYTFFNVQANHSIEVIANSPPFPSAGGNQTITLPNNSLAINANVFDDGETGPFTTQWSKIDGPGDVFFEDPSAIDTAATFSEPGIYTIQLEAHDGELTQADTARITVLPENLITECHDGIDNDGDGQIDYPDDPACDNPFDDNEDYERDHVYYLDTVNGNDSRDGLTPDSAWKTIAKSVNAFNRTPNESFLFYVAPGDYGGVNFEFLPRTAWVVYQQLTETKPSIDYFNSTNDGAIHLIFDGFKLIKSARGSIGGWWATVYLQGASHVKFVNSDFIPDDEHTHVYGDFPSLLAAFFSSDITALRNTFVGTRYGVSFSTADNLIFKGNDVGWQFADAIRCASCSNALFEENVVHDVGDWYPNEGEHMDGFQTFPVGGACSNPQSNYLTIRGNQFFNMPGQMIFIQGNWTGCLGEIQSITIQNNVLGKKSVEDASFPIQIGQTNGFVLSHNTVYEKVIVRAGSKGVVENNIFGYLSIVEDAEVTYDYNLLGSLVNNSQNTGDPGEHTVIGTPEFADVDQNDYHMLPGQMLGDSYKIDPCYGDSNGSYLGALPCLGCVDDQPLVVFTASTYNGYAPLHVDFDASKSMACVDGEQITSYDWDFGDHEIANGVQVSHIFETEGNYTVHLKVTDSLNQSAWREKEFDVFYSVPHLVFYLNLDHNIQDWSGRFHNVSWQNLANDDDAPYGPGRVHEAIELDGTDVGAYVLAQHADDLDGFEQATLAFFAKKTDREIGGDVLQKHVSYEVRVGQNSLSGYFFNVSGDRFNFNIPNDAIDDTSWHHYALTYNGSAVSIYMDGEFVQSFSMAGRVAVNPSRSLYVGKYQFTDGKAFAGALDEIQIYDVALNADDIANLANPARNTPPIVSAGFDVSALMREAVLLEGSVQDDGLPDPPGETTVQWSTVEGPGNASFSDPSSPVTDVRFGKPGKYTLRLTASDNELTAADDCLALVYKNAACLSADLIPDAQFDQLDVDYFRALFTNKDSQADWNHDGRIDTKDMMAYLSDISSCQTLEKLKSGSFSKK